MDQNEFATARAPRATKQLFSLKGLIQQYKKNYDLFLIFLPVLIYFIIFHYIPMVGIVIAFKDYQLLDGIFGSKWVGLANFKELFTTGSFFEVLRNTVWISFLRFVFGFPAPIILALLLNEIKKKWYKKLVQTVSYLPHFLSWVVLAGLFIQFFSPSTGPINFILKHFGLKPIYFLGEPNWFVFTIITTGIWQSIGWGTIIYLAAISNIDPQMYESAVLDGATRFQNVIYITLPSIMPTIAILLILNTGNILNAGFDQIFNLYNSAVLSVADIIDTYVYRRGLTGMEYSFATTVGLFKNVIGFILVYITNKIARKIGGSTLW